MGQPIPELTAVDVYRPRNPRASGYYQCVESHFEQLEQAWDDRYAPRLGFWRPYVKDVIYRYLDCGDLTFGFARVKCMDSGDWHCRFILPLNPEAPRIALDSRTLKLNLKERDRHREERIVTHFIHPER